VLPFLLFKSNQSAKLAASRSRSTHYAVGVTSEDLTPFQATELRKQVAGHLRYFNRLTDRMTRLGFDPSDPLYQAALKARDSLQEVHVAAHYASCTSGVGKPRRR
jgi:hypothetical protein